MSWVVLGKLALLVLSFASGPVIYEAIKYFTQRNCSICRNEIESSQNAVKCVRGHWYHRECRDCLREEGQYYCSVCRASY